jgi:hypothetical protein
MPWEEMGLAPKANLESRVTNTWREAQDFLQNINVDTEKLIVDGIHDPEAMDDALDTILGGHGHAFLQVANAFQHALELARPLRLKKEVRSAYDSLILLAHRVQALRPEAYNHRFLEAYNEDDTFFLYDIGHARKNLVGTETLAEAHARHKAAGRHNLATSLQSLAERVGDA